MKAIVLREFGPPGVMRLEAVPDPRPGETAQAKRPLPCP